MSFCLGIEWVSWVIHQSFSFILCNLQYFSFEIQSILFFIFPSAHIFVSLVFPIPISVALITFSYLNIHLAFISISQYIIFSSYPVLSSIIFLALTAFFPIQFFQSTFVFYPLYIWLWQLINALFHIKITKSFP